MRVGLTMLGNNEDAECEDRGDGEDFKERSAFSKSMAESHIDNTQLCNNMDKEQTEDGASGNDKKRTGSRMLRSPCRSRAWSSWRRT